MKFDRIRIIILSVGILGIIFINTALWNQHSKISGVDNVFFLISGIGLLGVLMLLIPFSYDNNKCSKNEKT